MLSKQCDSAEFVSMRQCYLCAPAIRLQLAPVNEEITARRRLTKLLVRRAPQGQKLEVVLVLIVDEAIMKTRIPHKNSTGAAASPCL
jgi:hypothetical protein